MVYHGSCWLLLLAPEDEDVDASLLEIAVVALLVADAAPPLLVLFFFEPFRELGLVELAFFLGKAGELPSCLLDAKDRRLLLLLVVLAILLVAADGRAEEE